MPYGFAKLPTQRDTRRADRREQRRLKARSGKRDDGTHCEMIGAPEAHRRPLAH